MDIKMELEALSNLISGASDPVMHPGFWRYRRRILIILQKINEQLEDIHEAKITSNAARIAKIEKTLANRAIYNHDPEPQAELKPCPFCGGPDILKNTDGINNIFWFYCNDCNAMANSDYSAYVARQNWNKRTQPKGDQK